MSPQLSPQVKRQGWRYGVPEREILDMIQRSARVTHPKGNRRYHEWVFEIQDGIVVNMATFEKEATIVWKSGNS